jgi:hypothetical protein
MEIRTKTEYEFEWEKGENLMWWIGKNNTQKKKNRNWTWKETKTIGANWKVENTPWRLKNKTQKRKSERERHPKPHVKKK